MPRSTRQPPPLPTHPDRQRLSKWLQHVGAPLLLAGLLATVPGCGNSSESKPAPASQALGPAETYEDAHRDLGSSVLRAADEGTISDAVLISNAALLDRVTEASKAKSCDFGADYSAGLQAQLPHLQVQRQLARVLRADASRLLAAGDKDGAAKRIAAIYRMAGQVGGSAQSVVELLSAEGMLEIANRIIQENQSLADAAWRTDVLQAMSEAQQQTLTRAPAIIEADAKLTGSWLRQVQDSQYATMAGQGLKPRTVEQRQAAATAIESIGAEAAKAWPTASPAKLKELHNKAKSKGVDDLCANYEQVKGAADKVEVSMRMARAALGG